MPGGDPLHQWADAHAAWARGQLAVEHFPEPCAVGGHGPVWCAECMKRWPCPDAAPAEQVEWDREEVAHAALAYEAGLETGLRQGYSLGQHMGMENGLAAAERRHGDRRFSPGASA